MPERTDGIYAGSLITNPRFPPLASSSLGFSMLPRCPGEYASSNFTFFAANVSSSSCLPAAPIPPDHLRLSAFERNPSLLSATFSSVASLVRKGDFASPFSTVERWRNKEEGKGLTSRKIVGKIARDLDFVKSVAALDSKLSNGFRPVACYAKTLSSTGRQQSCG